MITRMGWTRDEAIELINKHQEIIQGKFNYHLGLAGSVLNNGESSHDVDIIILPMHNENTEDYVGLVSYLKDNFYGTFCKTDNVKYTGENTRDIYCSSLNGNMIDWFIYR